jgi:hypothetical protein
VEEGAVNFYGCVGQMEKRRQRTQVTNLEYVDESARFNANSDSFIHQISYQPKTGCIMSKHCFGISAGGLISSAQNKPVFVWVQNS